MKKFLISIFLVSLSLNMSAQSEWEKPLSSQEKLEQAQKAAEEAKQAAKAAKQAAKEAKKAAKANKSKDADNKADKKSDNASKAKATKATALLTTDNKDYKYLKEGAIPETAEGNVEFTLEQDFNGQTAQQIYDKLYTTLDNLAGGEDQIKSGIALVNKKAHSIAAQYSEWLTFKKNFVNLDRSKFNYTILADCTDGHLHLTLSRISYSYEEDRPTAIKTSAEKWITDKYAVNKKGTKLLPGSAKFRRSTIDRVEEIFNLIKTDIQK